MKVQITAMFFLCLIPALQARIGETTEQSLKRYGDEKTMLKITQATDKAEVNLAEYKRLLEKLDYSKDFIERHKTSSEKEYFKRIEINKVKDISVKAAQYERFRKIQNEFRELQGKGEFEKRLYLANNKEISEFFGSRILSYDGLGAEIERLKKEIEFVMNLATNYGQEDPGLTMKAAIQFSEGLERAKDLVRGFKRQEEEFKKILSCKTGSKRLQFETQGYEVTCYIKNDITHQILYLRKDIASNDVMQILLNNSDEGVSWDSVVLKDVIIDHTEILPMVKYHSSDGKLGAVFAKLIKDKDDLGQMRAVFIYEKTDAAPTLILREQEGI